MPPSTASEGKIMTNENKPAPVFVRASERESDPVGTLDGDWGFWNEVWCDWIGGFANEEEARAGCQAYAARL